jgi:hypothetical protein
MRRRNATGAVCTSKSEGGIPEGRKKTEPKTEKLANASRFTSSFLNFAPNCLNFSATASLLFHFLASVFLPADFCDLVRGQPTRISALGLLSGFGPRVSGLCSDFCNGLYLELFGRSNELDGILVAFRGMAHPLDRLATERQDEGHCQGRRFTNQAFKGCAGEF